jgi:hypothetical protein
MKKGEVMPQEQRDKISKAHKGKPAPNRSYWLGKKRSPETIEKFRLAKLGTHRTEETKKKISETNKRIGKRPLVGKKENHPRWIKDRSKLQIREKKHLDTKYRYWMFQVKTRDKWKCRISNSDCGGRLESHHILNWIEYPELRYEINNGITLCHAHHPRGRANEKRMVSYFVELLSVSKE